METEFNGDPVAGGTFPALIWKTFTEAALRVRGDEPRTFEFPPFLSGTSSASSAATSACCSTTGSAAALSVVYFRNFGPKRTANCKLNEVEVPRTSSAGRSPGRGAGPARSPAARVGAG